LGILRFSSRGRNGGKKNNNIIADGLNKGREQNSIGIEWKQRIILGLIYQRNF
jgi:hypothetical protein